MTHSRSDEKLKWETHKLGDRLKRILQYWGIRPPQFAVEVN